LEEVFIADLIEFVRSFVDKSIMADEYERRGEGGRHHHRGEFNEGGAYGSEFGGGDGGRRPQGNYQGEGETQGYGADIGGPPVAQGGYGQQADRSGEQEEKKHHGLFHHGDKKEEEDPQQQYEKDHKHERYAEGAAAAAAGYGLYEHHEKKEDGEKLPEQAGYDEEGKKKHHHIF
jgi:hypothetical protein